MGAELHWVTISGRVEQSEERLIFEPTWVDGQPPPVALIRSNADFEQGEISLKVEFAAPRTEQLLRQPVGVPACRVQLGGPAQWIEAGIGGDQGALYGIWLWAPGWRPLASAGWGAALPANHPTSIRVSVKGVRIVLYVNDVMVCSATQELTRAPLAISFSGSQRVDVSEITITPARPKAFVVMQFGEEYDQIYREVIRPTCESHGFDVIRADDVYSNGLIIGDILESIATSSVVIADVTPENANVYYEVGFAHGLGRPTILMSDKRRERLPFDIAGVRTLFYDNTIGGKRQIEERLEKHLQAIQGHGG